MRDKLAVNGDWFLTDLIRLAFIINRIDENAYTYLSATKENDTVITANEAFTLLSLIYIDLY